MNRYLSNLLTTRRALRRAFPPAVLESIERAVAASERQHSGELRFAIETALDLPALLRGTNARDRALEAFTRLRVWDTRADNGVLIYLLLSERDIEIVADHGFEGKVGADQWQQVCAEMRQSFQAGEFERGALRAIERIGELIGRYFPPTSDDSNELPDKPTLL